MMNKLIKGFTFFCISIGLEACTNNNQSIKNIGGEKDKHGCLKSAGQTWSELQQNCIQIFNEGIRLNPTEKSTSVVFSAFILFNKDQSKTELFLPNGENKILNKTTNNIYENGIYKYDAATKTLFINNVIKYKID